MKHYKSLIIFLISLLFSNSLNAEGLKSEAILENNYPKYEVRAMWLTTIGGLDWPHCYAHSESSIRKQKQELCDILDKLLKAGINTILLQTRVRGTMIYPSAYEPWDGCLSGNPGKSPGYDALQYAIEECHKRGMELHAWVVTIPVGKWNGYGCKNLRNKFPGLITKIGLDGYMNPENPTTGRYLADICEEITRNYDIDGIHLDYIRYPETWKIKVSPDRGRKYITDIVKDINTKVKSQKPWVKMSCSPIGKSDDLSRYWSHGWNAYSKVCQDAQGWLRDGLMDELFPMMYFKGNNFFPFAIDWSEQNYGKIVAPGLGIYFMSPRESNWPLETITREMEVLRQYNMGHTYFRNKFFTDNTKGIYDFAANIFDKHPALIPAMTWEHATPPTPPTSMKITNNGMTTISWYDAKDNSKAPYLLYNVYSSRTFPVDVNDVRNLILSRTQKTSISLSDKDEDRYYAVTSLDRYGNESTPLQSHSANSVKSCKQLLACDGKIVKLSSKPQNLDAELIAIETLQGTIISTKNYNSNTINVGDIADGMYVVRSLDSKGRTHKIGFFIKKTMMQ